MEQVQTEQQVDMVVEGEKTLSMKVEPGFSGKPEDFARDMEILRKAEAPAEPVAAAVETPTEEVTEPAQPEATPQADETPEVPAKFQTKDGKLDEGKLEKATLSAEQQLAKYLELEKQLSRKAQEIGKAKKGETVYTAPQAQADPSADPFEVQIESDVQKYGAGKTLAKLFHAAKDAAKAEMMAEVQEIKQYTELAKRERELREIAKNDPWVFSQQGMETLNKYRETHPWLNDSPTPWTAAYKAYLGDQAFQQRTERQVTTPTPKNVKVPPAPITAAARSSAGTIDQARLVESLKKLTPEQEDAYWQKMGFPPIHNKRR